MHINRTILPGNTLQELLRPASFYKAGAFEPGPDAAKDTQLGHPASSAAAPGQIDQLETEAGLAIDPAERMLALNVWTDTQRNLRADGLEMEAPIHTGPGDSPAALAEFILQGWS